MTRLVRRSANSPEPLRIGATTKWLCRCGLSRRQPFCDGSHLAARSEWPGVVYEYEAANLRRRAVALEAGPDLDCRPGPWLRWTGRVDLLPELPETLREACRTVGITLWAAAWSDAPSDAIATLRSELLGAGVAVDEHEGRCVHVWAEDGTGVIGSIRGSIHRYAPLPDCGSFDAVLMRRLGPAACSGTRLVARRTGGPLLAGALITGCWAVGLWYGCRVNVTNATVRAARYYRRLGFQPVAGSEFRHPVLGTPSVVLLNPADPACPDPLGTLFADRAMPLTSEILAEIVDGRGQSLCGTGSVPHDAGRPRITEGPGQLLSS